MQYFTVKLLIIIVDFGIIVYNRCKQKVTAFIGHHILQDNVSDAWLSAVQYILKNPNLQCSNLMVEITNPLAKNNTIEVKSKFVCKIPRSSKQ